MQTEIKPKRYALFNLCYHTDALKNQEVIAKNIEKEEAYQYPPFPSVGMTSCKTKYAMDDVRLKFSYS